MLPRREHLGRHPSIFRSMTGLTVQAFDQMLRGLLTTFHEQRRRRLDRPDRQRAFGGGDDFDPGLTSAKNMDSFICSPPKSALARATESSRHTLPATMPPFNVALVTNPG